MLNEDTASVPYLITVLVKLKAMDTGGCQSAENNGGVIDGVGAAMGWVTGDARQCSFYVLCLECLV